MWLNSKGVLPITGAANGASLAKLPMGYRKIHSPRQSSDPAQHKVGIWTPIDSWPSMPYCYVTKFAFSRIT